MYYLLSFECLFALCAYCAYCLKLEYFYSQLLKSFFRTFELIFFRENSKNKQIHQKRK